jgi:hypothetical protein
MFGITHPVIQHYILEDWTAACYMSVSIANPCTFFLHFKVQCCMICFCFTISTLQFVHKVRYIDVLVWFAQQMAVISLNTIN